jgi:hypothetical protein
VIEEVSPQFIEPGGQLTIRGRNLSADTVQVKFGAGDHACER